MKIGIICVLGDSEAFAAALKKIKSNADLRKEYTENSKKTVRPFLLSKVKGAVLGIFENFGDE